MSDNIETSVEWADDAALRFVLVDDDRAIGEELADFVRVKFASKTNGQVDLFDDPRKALGFVNGLQGPVLMISDITMPGGSGLDLVAAVKAAESDQRPIEALIISGCAGMREATRAIQVGASDFLLKPVDFNDLNRALGLAISRLQDRWSRSRALGQILDGLASLAGHPTTPGSGNGSGNGMEHAASPPPKSQSESQPESQSASQRPDETARPVAARTATGVGLKVIERQGGGKPVSPMPVEDSYDTLALVKLLQSIRRVRNKFFPGCSQGDPGWEILLYVIEQDLLGRPVSVTSACHATLIPQTTAMRKLDELVDDGMIQRVPDELDRRRVLLSPTDDAREAARHFLAHVLEQASTTMPGDRALAAE